MKTMKIVAVLVACLFLFKPQQTAFTQAVLPVISGKEQENKKLKASIEQSQDVILKTLNNAVEKSRKKVKPKVVYVYLTPEGKAGKKCDTVYYVIKKKTGIQRLFSNRKADTLKIER